jgi:hypothetical protein
MPDSGLRYDYQRRFQNIFLQKEEAMKLRDVKTIAKAKAVKAGTMGKPELIRAIQKAEGNFECYGSAAPGTCDQSNCLWRQDCLSLPSGQ